MACGCESDKSDESDESNLSDASDESDASESKLEILRLKFCLNFVLLVT